MGEEVEEVRPQQRLSPREEHRRYPETGQILEEPLALSGGQLAGKLPIAALRVAVAAGEVAAAGDVPDDYRPALSAGARRVRRGMASAVAEVVARRGSIVQQRAYTEHAARSVVA